jgi:hypothetical protein
MNKFLINDLTIDEINLITVGLYELPGKYTVNLIPKIKEQMEKQGAKPTPGSQASGDNFVQQPGPVPVGPLSNKVVN